MIQSTSQEVFKQLWNIYFAGKLGRLAIHPVANFVASAAFAKLDEDLIISAVSEMSKVMAKNLSGCFSLSDIALDFHRTYVTHVSDRISFSAYLGQHRVGPVTSLVNRTVALKKCQAEIVEVRCLLHKLHLLLISRTDYMQGNRCIRVRATRVDRGAAWLEESEGK